MGLEKVILRVFGLMDFGGSLPKIGLKKLYQEFNTKL